MMAEFGVHKQFVEKVDKVEKLGIVVEEIVLGLKVRS